MIREKWDAVWAWGGARVVSGRAWLCALWRGRVLPIMGLIIGWYGEKSRGSNVRRVLGRLTLAMVVIAVLELIFVWAGEKGEALPIVSLYMPVLWGVFYFMLVTVWPMFFVRDLGFRISPPRLLRDLMKSGALSIVVFALVFRKLGVEGGEGMELRPVWDSVYFAAVTFSTLGFGDFRPSADARLYAAFLGLWGNVHLGLLAGAVFMALSDTSKSGPPVGTKKPPNGGANTGDTDKGAH